MEPVGPSRVPHNAQMASLRPFATSRPAARPRPWLRGHLRAQQPAARARADCVRAFGCATRAPSRVPPSRMLPASRPPTCCRQPPPTCRHQPPPCRRARKPPRPPCCRPPHPLLLLQVTKQSRMEKSYAEAVAFGRRDRCNTSPPPNRTAAAAAAQPHSRTATHAPPHDRPTSVIHTTHPLTLLFRRPPLPAFALAGRSPRPRARALLTRSRRPRTRRPRRRRRRRRRCRLLSRRPPPRPRRRRNCWMR